MQGAEKPVIERTEKPVYWLMWRFERQSYFCPTTDEQLWMMQALQAGKSFAEVCEGLCDWLEEDKVAPFAAETLRGWVSEGIFSEYKISS